MLKQILVAVIAVQLVVVPVQAETTDKKLVQCTKGFVGIDDVAIYFAVGWLAIQTTLILGKIAQRYNDEVKAKQLKIQDQRTPECKL